MFQGVTIDPEGSRDLDDAIWVDRTSTGWLLRVAVPRVAGALPAGGQADRVAFSRAFTRYGSEGIRRGMVDDALVTALSLTPESDKDVALVTIPVDRAYVAGEPEVAFATFRSVGRLTYAQASEAVVRQEGPFVDMLSHAWDLARGLQARRARSGSLAFAAVVDGVSTDEEGQAVAVDPDCGVAHDVVCEAMILANVSLAALFRRRGLPLLFRNQGVHAKAGPRPSDGSAPVGSRLPWDHKGGSVEADVARVGPLAEGHYALHLPAYAWFTSPIRRYVDVVNQRLLEDLVAGRPPSYDEAALTTVAASLNSAYESHRDRASSFHKGVAFERAGRRIAEGDFERASGGDFKAIVKAATVGGMMTEQVAREAMVRLREGTLHAKEVTRLLVGGGPLAEEVVAFLRDRPFVAAGVVNHGVQSLGWTPVSLGEHAEGPPHARRFGASALLVTPEGEHRSPTTWAGTQKEARQFATLIAVAMATGLVPPEPAPRRPDATAPVAVAPAEDWNPRNAVQEICQRRGWAMPVVQVEAEGPPHAPTFSAVVSLTLDDGRRIRSAPCRSQAKRAAERLAFADLHEAVGRVLETRARAGGVKGGGG